MLKVPYAKMYFSGSPNLLLRSFRCEPQTCLPSNMPPKIHPNVLHGRPRFGPSFVLSLICVCVCACAFFFFLAHGLVGPVLLGSFQACAISAKVAPNAHGDQANSKPLLLRRGLERGWRLVGGWPGPTPRVRGWLRLSRCWRRSQVPVSWEHEWFGLTTGGSKHW